MAEKIILAVVLLVAVAAVVRAVVRAVARAGDSSKSPACSGCPFESKCEMQDKPHADECGSDGGE